MLHFFNMFVRMCMFGAQQEASSYEVKEAQLAALRITPAAQLHHLVTSQLLNVLNTWLISGNEDRQTSFIRCVLSW